MKIPLDENFPLGLLRRLHAEGFVAEHIITLGWRGASDTRIRERLQDPSVLFLTQDEDFLSGRPLPALVVISRVRQARPLAERIDVWLGAVRELLQASSTVRLYELADDGTLRPAQTAR